MKLSPSQVNDWQREKADLGLLLPIIYVRGYAMSGGEIDDTTSDPFNGFNVGSVLLRTGWTGDSTRHVFESPILRFTQPPYNYRLAFSDGIRGLDAQTQNDLREWADLTEESSTTGPTPRAVIAIYRYYDTDSHILGSGERAGMETYGWGLARLALDLMATTKALGVFVVAHSMGGLVARCFLQNDNPLDGSHKLLGRNCKAVEALITGKRAARIDQPDWDTARKAVKRFFTYGTPHNGITGQGGQGNWLLNPLNSLLGMDLGNFEKENIQTYLSTETANSLNGKFSVEDTFCLIGTGSADYPAAGGFSRRLVGQLSDGLVEVDNAYVCGPSLQSTADQPETILAARAYVRRAHSGPYGMVNSEEGFGNLSRFLFGNVRVDGDLIVRQVDLPQTLQALIADAPATKPVDVNASYSFESFLRVRGENWAMTERLVRDGAAIFRRYDELLPNKRVPHGLVLTPQQLEAKRRPSRIELFTAFLDTALRSDPLREEKIGDTTIRGSLGFALHLRIAVPNYEVDGLIWRKDHYEGSALLDQDIVFLAFREPSGLGEWRLAWGPNRADSNSNNLSIVEPAPLGCSAQDGSKSFSQIVGDTVEFWLPIEDSGPPVFRAWLRLTAASRPQIVKGALA